MPVVEKPEIVQEKEKKLKSLGQKYVVNFSTSCCTSWSYMRDVLSVKPKIVVLSSSAVFQSTSKNAKMDVVLQVKKFHLIWSVYFSDLTIQYGENEALHLLALKEVNAKEAPDMTQEEAIGLQDLDDAFVLAQAEKNAQDDLLETLDTSHTEV